MSARRNLQQRRRRVRLASRREIARLIAFRSFIVRKGMEILARQLQVAQYFSANYAGPCNR